MHLVEGTPATPYGRVQGWSALGALAVGVALAAFAKSALAAGEIREAELRARRRAAAAENLASDADLARLKAEHALEQLELERDEPPEDPRPASEPLERSAGVEVADGNGSWTPAAELEPEPEG